MADEGLNQSISATETGKVAIPWGTPMPTDNELAALTPELKAMLEEGVKRKRLFLMRWLSQSHKG